MKNLLIRVAALTVLAVPAFAADMAVRPAITKAPALAATAAYNWSGFYSATTVGGNWWNVDGDFVAAPTDHHNTSGSKFLLGSSYGAQYQWNNWVIGVEAGYTALFNSDYATSLSASADCLASTANRTCEARIRNYWQAGGRVGYAWNNVMAFASGGYANGRIQSQVLVTSAPNTVTSFTSERHDGWYAGGGVEMFVGRWLWSDTIIGVEYQHVEFNTRRHVELLSTAVNNRDMSASMDLIQARITFKYSLGALGAGPVTAAY
jgi:outer membrane immunogenic protein